MTTKKRSPSEALLYKALSAQHIRMLAQQLQELARLMLEAARYGNAEQYVRLSAAYTEGQKILVRWIVAEGKVDLNAERLRGRDAGELMEKVMQALGFPKEPPKLEAPKHTEIVVEPESRF